MLIASGIDPTAERVERRWTDVAAGGGSAAVRGPLLRAKLRAAPWELDDETAGGVRRLVADLGLRMGIGDAKLDPDGRPVWLELNPRGRFLFLEGMGEGLALTHPFAEFLPAEAAQPSPAV